MLHPYLQKKQAKIPTEEMEDSFLKQNKIANMKSST
jgi:hypothetical protein